jgi:hypothetical protein
MSRAQGLSASRAARSALPKSPIKNASQNEKTILDDSAPRAITQAANLHRSAVGGRLQGLLRGASWGAR